MCTTTTRGEIFTNQDTAQMAWLIYRCFGRDPQASLAAWQRLLQNNCDTVAFMALVCSGWRHLLSTTLCMLREEQRLVQIQADQEPLDCQERAHQRHLEGVVYGLKTAIELLESTMKWLRLETPTNAVVLVHTLQEEITKLQRQVDVDIEYLDAEEKDSQRFLVGMLSGLECALNRVKEVYGCN